MDVKIPGDFGIPMNSVYRLEDFASSAIRGAMDRSIVVYREQSMPLIELSTILGAGISGVLKPVPVSLEERERVSVLVFRTRKGQFFGCVVDRIRDFVTIEGALNDSGRSHEFIKGTVLLEGNKVMSVLDPEVIIRAASAIFDDPRQMPAFVLVGASDNVISAPVRIGA
jgi:chemotaxis protein histidine kinase CheA